MSRAEKRKSGGEGGSRHGRQHGALMEREVIALVCSSDVDLVNSERVVK